MSRYISDKVRSRVEKRANYQCEYCLIHQDDTFFSCQIDHIISIKHGGDNAERLEHLTTLATIKKMSLRKVMVELGLILN